MTLRKFDDLPSGTLRDHGTRDRVDRVWQRLEGELDAAAPPNTRTSGVSMLGTTSTSAPSSPRVRAARRSSLSGSATCSSTKLYSTRSHARGATAPASSASASEPTNVS